LSSTIYMSVLGKKGMKDVAVNSTNKAHYLYNELLKTGVFTEVTKQNFYKEFLLESKIDVSVLNNSLNEAGILSLLEVEKNIVQIAVTENRTKEELDYFIKTVEVM